MSISLEKIVPYLQNKEQKVTIYKEINSTNLAARELGGIVIAESQTHGYGKYDRHFYSPQGGLYMSIVLPCGRTPAEYTMMAAVAVCRAIELVCGKTPGIKWVNDIILDNKKVGGILAESDGEKVIVGIGLNVFTKDFPQEIPNAGAVMQGAGEEALNALAAEIINLVFSKGISFYDEYKSRMVLVGELVQVSQGGEVFEAKILDVQPDGRLAVQKADGTKVLLVAAEVERVCF